MLRLKEGAMKSIGVESNSRTVPKNAVTVAISLADGTTVMAKTFVQRFSRVTDLLNDERKFISVQTFDGEVLALAKSFITHVALKEQDTRRSLQT